MNQSFSLRRLWLLVRQQGTENIRLYLLAVAAIAGTLLLTMGYIVFMTRERGYPAKELQLTAFFGLYIAGATFASISFRQVHEPAEGTLWLTQPASSLEKLICIALYGVVLYTIVYLVCLYLAHATVLIYVKHLAEADKDYKYSPNDYLGYDQVDLRRAFLPVQCFFIAGSIYFKRYAFLKTTALTIVCTLLFLTYYNLLCKGMLGTQYSWTDNTIRLYNLPDQHSGWKEFRLAGWVFSSLGFAATIGLPVCFLSVAWFRLKEKQL